MSISSNKEIYRNLCKTEETIQIFIQDWWLDAVCGADNWNVLLSYANDESVKGSLCFYVKEKMGLKYITQPKFSQNTGLWLNYPKDLSHEKKLSFEKETCFDLIKQLEEYTKANRIVFYQQAFDTRYTNWLPFYWKGYQQTTAYTYRIEYISKKNENDLLLQYNNSKQKEIKRSKKRKLEFHEDLQIDVFYKHHKDTLHKRGRDISYDYSLIEKIHRTVKEHKSGTILYITNQTGEIYCARFIIWDKIGAYSLASSTNQEQKTSGASSLLFHYCINYAKNFVDVFDFEGSMIEDVENSYRKFGTIQTPYLCINKIMTNNKLIKYILGKKINGR